MIKISRSKEIFNIIFKSLFFVPIMFIVIFFLLFKTVFADSNSSRANSISWDSSYDIAAYDVDVKVNTDNVLDVTETITADFHEEKHGIYRKIPLSAQNASLNDNSIVKKHVSDIRDISVTDEKGKVLSYEKSREGDNLELKIGEGNKTLKGKHTYVIKFSYDIGEDNNKEYDELYYNIIGHEWDTAISNTTFEVHMPKDFDKNNVSITSGFSNSEQLDEQVSYSIDGNTIKGKVNALFISPGTGVTIRAKLPEGYFYGFKDDNKVDLTLLYELFMGLSLLLFVGWGRNKRIYASEEISLPVNLNSAEAGYLLEGSIKSRHTISLIIYWANKGYLNIWNDLNNDFVLTKLREADNEMKDYEKLMFNKLFENRATVTAKELNNNFYSTVSTVNASIISYFNDSTKRQYTKTGALAQLISFIFAGLSVGLMVGKTVGPYDFSLYAGIAAGIATFIFTIIYAAVIGYLVNSSRTKSKIMLIISIIIWLLILGIIGKVVADYTNDLEAYISVVSAFVCIIFGAYSKRRTDYYNSWLSRLMSFRNYIQMKESFRFKSKIEANEFYIYDVLPYAYAFGLSKDWADRFSNLSSPLPTWFNNQNNENFGLMYFMVALNHNLANYENNMTSSPSDGSYSGGDSGGGSGGGGGGSW
jgi:uncharacterized membrane protein YgcG